ncbi:MAG TPA: DUF87 domain-containing protein [Candidatus Merdibacter merdigallinarum]|nr:DUF87 domain-containing protein [Candidatus Merdibacter merdigallinarum]
MAVPYSSGLQQLENSIVAVKDFISKSYLNAFPNISTEVLAVNEPDKAKIGIRLLRIRQITISDELIESRLTSIYQTINQLVNSCFLLIQGTAEGISLYVGIHSNAPGTAEKALIQTLTGNFPGIIVESLNASRIETVMERMKSGNVSGLKTVAAVSVVPSPREDQGESASVQGIEKFMDTMQGKEFTAMILATPYSEAAVNQRILALESIYTTLSAMEKTVLQHTSGNSYALTDTTAKTVSNAISTSMNQAFSVGGSQTRFTQHGRGNGFSITPLGLGISFSGQTGSGNAQTTTQGVTRSSGQGSTVGNASTVSSAINIGQNQSVTVVKTETNKEIQDLLAKIDKQIQRLKGSEIHGLWDCCGYFISNANDTAIVAANSFQGIVTGDSSDVEQSVISMWQPTPKNEPLSNHDAISNLANSLSLGIAPLFCANNVVRRTESIVTGKELSRMMGFPRKSAGDVSVIRMAAFGRKVYHIGGREPNGESFPIGKVMHMGRVEENSDVCLDLQKLTAHAFATGASGSGKTTAVCQILNELYKNRIPFTVIEPAKGEYGELWGNMEGIDVYSTSPFRYRMLRLNPFAFDEKVHLLDHMERLISVFSTAWPLYAAQPAVLRDCVRRAYMRCGWDIRNSVCLKTPKQYPTFREVLAELPGVIRASKFVGEARGTYEGALQTRLSMLTEGIFGELLCSEHDIPNEKLFDKNVIIDLSRLGAPETLSLIMGVLLIRLYEHRLTAGKAGGLAHITVLEEAHNILKRTSSIAQSEDGPSVGSKAVEVLSKCIAELRFTGEGFIIADQSPGELDASAMKNTSTKIVMRLQEAADQSAVGAALGLMEQQMAELYRLDKGVAIVHQEGWNEPVLTKVNDFKSPHSTKGIEVLGADVAYHEIIQVRAFLLREVLHQYAEAAYSVARFDRCLRRIDGFSKWKIADYSTLFHQYDDEFQTIKAEFHRNRVRYPFFGRIITELLDCEDLFEIIPVPLPSREMQAPYSADPGFIEKCREWEKIILSALNHYCADLNEQEKKLVIKLLLLAHGEGDSAQVRVQAALKHKNGVT